MKKQRLQFFGILSIFFFSSCLNDLPESISSDVEVNTSLAFPIGETSLELNEISGFNEDLLQINPLTNKPYWVEYEEIPLVYSMSFEVGDIYQSAEEIVQLVFRLNIYNEFPSDVEIQLYFFDSNGFMQDVLFQNGPLELKAAKVDENGTVLSKTHEKKDIVFESGRIQNLQLVNTLTVSVVFSTKGIDENLVQYYQNYHVDIQIGVKADLRFNP
jgi:hypothetical protein